VTGKGKANQISDNKTILRDQYYLAQQILRRTYTGIPVPSAHLWYFTHENHEGFFLQFLPDFYLCVVWLLFNVLFKLKLGAKYLIIVSVGTKKAIEPFCGMIFSIPR
jgi:hypothetical protein